MKRMLCALLVSVIAIVSLVGCDEAEDTPSTEEVGNSGTFGVDFEDIF